MKVHPGLSPLWQEAARMEFPDTSGLSLLETLELLYKRAYASEWYRRFIVFIWILSCFTFLWLLLSKVDPSRNAFFILSECLITLGMTTELAMLLIMNKGNFGDISVIADIAITFTSALLLLVVLIHPFKKDQMGEISIPVLFFLRYTLPVVRLCFLTKRGFLSSQKIEKIVFSPV